MVVGPFVGAGIVGAGVGFLVGGTEVVGARLRLGAKVVGFPVGPEEGTGDGAMVGLVEGMPEGAIVGGVVEGPDDGSADGMEVVG